MARRRYLVAYDISDDDRRNRVFKTLNGFGERVQYSVFLCELNAREIIALKSKLLPVIHQREDQIMLVDLGAVDGERSSTMETLGRALSTQERVIVV